MRSRFYEKLANILLTVIAFAFLPCRSVADSAITSHVDGNAQYGQKPATLVYARKVTTLIRSTWAHSVDLCLAHHIELSFGKIVVHLSVDQDGKVINPHVTSGDIGSILSQISLDAVSNAPLPAMSADAIKKMNGKRLPFDATFEYLPERHSNRRSSSR